MPTEFIVHHISPHISHRRISLRDLAIGNTISTMPPSDIYTTTTQEPSTSQPLSPPVTHLAKKKPKRLPFADITEQMKEPDFDLSRSSLKRRVGTSSQATAATAAAAYGADGLPRPDHLLLPGSQNVHVEPLKRRSRTVVTAGGDDGDADTFPLSDPYSFVVAKRSYRQQFSNIYYTRLLHLRKSVQKAAEIHWVDGHVDGGSRKPVYVDKVLDVTGGELCYIIGTVYCDMPNKPNILEDVQKDHYSLAPPPRTTYTSAEDRIALEDESGRVVLTGAALKKGHFVSGIIVAALGWETPTGEFNVIDHCLPGLAPQKTLNLPVSSPDVMNYIAFVSGLEMGGESSAFSTEMLNEYLTGELGSRQDQEMSSRIVRVILAGNVLTKRKNDTDDSNPRDRQSAPANPDSEPSRQLDNFMETLCSTISSVDYMPGATDPANLSLPQQPPHRSMFEKSARFSSLKGETNPLWTNEGGVSLLGTSGQTLDDIYKYFVDGDRLDLACATLNWRHMAPTAPDTLWCYPYSDEDPFIMKESPHVYFIGNQPEYATRVVQGSSSGDSSQSPSPSPSPSSNTPPSTTRVILIPSFAKTGTIVLLNLSTLECTPVNFEPLLSR